MSTPTTQELIDMAFAGQENFVPAAEEAQQELPHTFLALAPTTSASFPLNKSPVPQSPVRIPTPNNTQIDTIPAQNATPALPMEAVDEILKQRRSSSLSSDGSVQKKRFLKLGPVHFGEGDGKGDWSEEVLEE